MLVVRCCREQDKVYNVVVVVRGVIGVVGCGDGGGDGGGVGEDEETVVGKVKG